MDCVIIGPSDKSSLWNHGNILEKDYEMFVNEYAEFLSKNFTNVFCVPDEGVYLDIAKKYFEISGKKAIAYYPNVDDSYLLPDISKYEEYFELRPINGGWYKLNGELCRMADNIICVGFSPGVLIEISYIKYHQKYLNQKTKIFIDERTINQKLPSIFNEQIKNIKYYTDLEKLKSFLN